MKTKRSSVFSIRNLGIAAIAAVTALYSGCFLVVLGEGKSAYLFGEFNTTLPSSVAAVDKAANLALTHLRYVKVSQDNSLVDATIVARTRDDATVSVGIERTGAERSRLRIRVGAAGDEAVSRRLTEEIKANL